MADTANITRTTRRKLLKSIGAVSLVASCAPTAVSAVFAKPYTVSQHIADMRACGAYFIWMPDAILHNVGDVDWDRYDIAWAKAKTAGITPRQIWEAMRPADAVSSDIRLRMPEQS